MVRECAVEGSVGSEEKPPSMEAFHMPVLVSVRPHAVSGGWSVVCGGAPEPSAGPVTAALLTNRCRHSAGLGMGPLMCMWCCVRSECRDLLEKTALGDG